MSEQNILKVNIQGKNYPISCQKGEEERVIKSAKLLNEVIETIQNPDEKISENRILLMASLILADKNITNNIDKNETNFNLISSKEVLVWLERINLKINKVASLLDES
tara:strand:- start:237 stop:560 length:324 start_codon:yes stop_codon:yes gene_type:complete